MANNTQWGHKGAGTSCWVEQQSDLQLTPPPVNPSINLHVSPPAEGAQRKNPPPSSLLLLIQFYLYFLLSFSAWIHPGPGKLPSYFTNALGKISLSRKSVITQELYFSILSFTFFHVHGGRQRVEKYKKNSR